MLVISSLLLSFQIHGLSTSHCSRISINGLRAQIAQRMNSLHDFYLGLNGKRRKRPRGNLMWHYVLWNTLFHLLTFTLWSSLKVSVSGLDISRRGGITNKKPFRFGDTSSRNKSKVKVTVAVVLPHSIFKTKKYLKQIKTAAESLTDLTFEKNGFELSPYLEMVQPIPTPTEVLGKICDQFLRNNTAAILYLNDNENYGRYSVASQYFIQLAQYVQLPIISWNADNSAFEQGTGESLQLQLAPTIKHQARAILTLLERYGWHTFSIVTGQIAGHRNFEQVDCTLFIFTTRYLFSSICCFKLKKVLVN